MHYDVIVIGAGSVGMAAGYFLSKNGQNTLLIDAFDPPHTNGSHHGDTRIIRHAYGEGEKYVPLALKAQALWEELAEQSGLELFLKTGVLNVGHKKSAFIQNILSSAKTYALPLEVLQASEVNERWPGIALQDSFVGCFEQTSGVLKPEACIDAYRKLAEEEGATLLTNHRVKALVVRDNYVAVKMDDKTVTANQLVVSAGAWAGDLLRTIDLKLPLTPVRKTFAWFNADETLYNANDFPAFSFETPEGLYYGFPSIDRAGLKVGRHDGGAPIHPDEKMTSFDAKEKDATDLMQFLHTYMPTVEQLTYGKTCMYTLTPDEDFIIDLHPEHSNVAIAAGFSGHGFKFSSAVGQIVSELLISGKTEQDLSSFSIQRFQ